MGGSGSSEFVCFVLFLIKCLDYFCDFGFTLGCHLSVKCLWFALTRQNVIMENTVCLEYCRIMCFCSLCWEQVKAELGV